jgi:hypothetical protein
MQVLINDFKDLINGSRKFEEIYEEEINNNRPIPDIKINEIDDQIVVTGNFELSSDLVFNAGENYPKVILFDGGTYKNIIFRGGYFKKLIFRRGTYNGFVSIRGGNIDYLLLLGGSFNHWLGTLDGLNNIESGERNLADENLIIRRFEIEGGSYANNIWLSGGEIDSLEIKCVSPIKLHCKPSDDKEYSETQKMYVRKFNSIPKIKNLIISRYSNKDNYLHFSELKLDMISFENFTNIGNITIAKIEVTNLIQIGNSDLGKIAFIDCNFSNQQMFFDSSRINEISLAGVQLPNSNNIHGSKNKRVQKKLALSQIKKAYQNMGDSITASHYQSEELRTYMQTLPWGQERVNLFLNYHTNNFGQSWTIPLGLILGLNTILFSLYCYSLGFVLDFSIDGLKTFTKNSAYFIEFINPIRKNSFLPDAIAKIKEESNIPALTVAIDSISKLINAYLIYQFIAAFRKHGKKGE